jgi:uncharacterized protein (DUF433 family)
MRLTTLLLVSIFLIASVAVYANGLTPTQPGVTEEQPVTPTVPPSGAGPTVTPQQPICPTTATPVATMDVETYNTNYVVSTFCVDSASVTALRQSGWSWGDIYVMASIARNSGRSILEIANARSQGLPYDQVAACFNVSSTQILAPTPITRVAGTTQTYGYLPIYYCTDPWGNPSLTRFDAERLTRLGYDWRDIAAACNITSRTGVPVRDVLAWTDRGYTWPQIARIYGVSMNSVTSDIERYPFPRTCGGGPVCPPTGTGPVCPQVCPPTTTCPPVSTVPVCPPVSTGQGPVLVPTY